MTRTGLDAGQWQALTKPRAIAVVGASDRPGPLNFARRLARNNEVVGYAGAIYFVNPRYSTVLGRPCYPDLSSVPGPVDVCAINVSADHVLDAARDAVRIGVRALVVHSGGFAEAGAEGAARQEELLGLCAENNVALIGPNCLGMYHSGGRAAVYGADVPDQVRTGGLAMISGSGSVSTSFMRLGTEVGLHSVFSTGNEAVTSAEDVLERLLEDPAVGVVAMFVESLRRPEKFAIVARRALELGTPIIVLKAGTTAVGARTAQSHTGAIVGNGDVYAALFEQLGVIQVHDFDQLRETVRLLSTLAGRTPSGSGLGIVGISGGKLSVVADLADRVGVAVPSLSEHTARQVARELKLPDGVGVDNPVDVGAGFRNGRSVAETLAATMGLLAADPEIGVLLLSQNITTSGGGMNVVDQATATAVLDAAAALKLPVVLAAEAAGELTPAVVDAAAGAASPLNGLGPALVAIRGLLRWSAARRVGPDVVDPAPPDLMAATRTRVAGKVGLLDPVDTEWLLTRYGIPCAPVFLARSEDDLDRPGLNYPVVAKVVSAHISHKSDVGGVVLDIADRDALHRAYAQIHDSVRSARPTARIDAVQVSPMHSGGVELFVGSRVEPGIGPVVAVGLGGTLVELLPPPRVLVAPFSLRAARDALDRMPGSAVLKGFRGAPEADLAVLAETLCAVASLTTDLGDRIEAIDLNPVLIAPGHLGGLAVDARITLRAELRDTNTTGVTS